VTCDRVVFIKDGEVVASEDLHALSQSEIRVRVRARKLSQQTVAGLATWSTSASLDGEHLTLTTPSMDVLPDILRHLVAAGADVYELKPERHSLEEVFVRIMGEDQGL